MTNEDVQRRLKEIENDISIQLLPNTDGFIALRKDQAELVISLIDTVLRWDYEIKL